MLLIEYGIEQAEDSKLDAGFICDKWLSRRRDFDDLCDILMEWTQQFPFKHCYQIARRISLVKLFSLLGEYKIDYSDLAIMLYYYITHRKPVNAVDYESGITG